MIARQSAPTKHQTWAAEAATVHLFRGERAGIHFTSMWRYKKGAKIGQKNAERLAPVLGVRPAELLFGNDEPTAAEKARAAKAAVEVPVADIVESPF